MHVIREIVHSDLPALAAIADATEIFPGETLDGMTAGFFAGDSAGDAWLTLEDDGRPVALAYYVPERMTDGTWNVLALAVHPGSQGRGHGSALMRHIEEKLAARGERVLLVETSGTPAFERTRAFYRGLDYGEEARIRDFYEAGDDKVVFRKALEVELRRRG